MATLSLSLELSPAELLGRLPRRAGAFLLDGGGPESWARGVAFLGCEPTRVVEFRGEPPRFGASRSDPFALLEDALHREACAGVVCALGYDLGRWAEQRLGPARADGSGRPRLFAAVHPWVLVYSYLDQSYQLQAPHLDERELAPIADRLRLLAGGRVVGPTAPRMSAEASPSPFAAAPRSDAFERIASNFTRRSYLAAVRQVLEYIAAGDVYQVNLSQRFTAPAPAEAPARLFARLLARHPTPFSAYVDGGPWALVSNSPECFLRLSADAVSTFPIKGTRPRGAGSEEDRAMAAALRSSVKDRAEHLMIVDLERNDLGRLCRIGTVRVPTYAHLRSFPSLHHLESEVAGELAPGTSLAALLRATFPGGSITGAPKIRAMQIIDELEGAARGFYTGAIGWVTPDGACFNIAIRTATVTEAEVSYHAGGGIVADSDPEAEYEETQLKARAFFDTLQAASG